MTRRARPACPKHQPIPPPPVPVAVPLPLLEAARAAYPAARDWTDAQVAAACVALAIRLAVPRNGLVHGE